MSDLEVKFLFPYLCIIKLKITADSFIYCNICVGKQIINYLKQTLLW